MENSALPRRAELLAALSLAMDLGLGQPMEHLLRSCVLGSRVSMLFDLPPERRDRVFYTTLVAWLGCQADSPELLFGDGISFRGATYVVDARGLTRARLTLGHVTYGETPLVRGIQAARLRGHLTGRQVNALVRSHWSSARTFCEQLGIADIVGEGDTSQSALATAPTDRVAGGEELSDVLTAMGDWGDARSAFTAGHSRAVPDLAARAAAGLGHDEVTRTRLGRAGHVHDLGRLGIPSAIWDKSEPLTQTELDRVGGAALIRPPVGYRSDLRKSPVVVSRFVDAGVWSWSASMGGDQWRQIARRSRRGRVSSRRCAARGSRSPPTPQGCRRPSRPTGSGRCCGGSPTSWGASRLTAVGRNWCRSTSGARSS